MATRTMSDWQTSICRVVSKDDREEIHVRGFDLNDLIGDLGFAGMMFLLIKGEKPTPAQARVLDALLVASMEHGIAPPSMIPRCFASYGTTIQQAIGGGIMAFGERMGSLGEKMASMMVETLAGSTGSDDDLAARAKETVERFRHRGERVPGFGIPLHDRDPRADRVLEIAKEQGVFGLYCRFAMALEAALAEARDGHAVPLNIDGLGACITLDLGLPWQATQMTLLTPRSVSMGVHYLEEREQDSTWRHIPADTVEFIE